MSASRPVPVMGNGIPRSRNSPDGTQPGAACLCRRPWGTLPAFLGGASRPKGCSGEESRGVGYHCVVCVKQVPDTKGITGEAMRDDGTVNRAALPAIFNPEDLNALEAALQIRDQFGGTVTVVAMGLPAACEVLRESLNRGADRAILITDRRAAASDTLATSYILSCAVKKLH